ncbi:MAG: SURF1 family protein [Burkholderiaceae bacterium]|nr:SURF1 family protein [Burkholderiaceae bacterium]
MLKSFRLRLIPLIACLALTILGVILGQWQLGRAAEKEAIEVALKEQEKRPPIDLLTAQKLVDQGEDLSYRRVQLQGNFIRDWVFYLDNRPLHGVAGFYVLMPFKVAGSEHVILVARGWQARNPVNRTALPSLLMPQESVNIEGHLRPHLARVMQLGQAEKLKTNAIVQNLQIAEVEQATGMKLFHFMLEQDSDLKDGLDRDWPKPSAGADKHRAYAFQWFGLSIMTIIFFVVTGLRRGKNS